MRTECIIIKHYSERKENCVKYRQAVLVYDTAACLPVETGRNSHPDSWWGQGVVCVEGVGGSGSLSRYTADSWAGHRGGSRNKRLCTRCRSGKTRNKDNGYFDEKPSSRGEILTKTEAVLIFVCEAADWKWKLCLFMKSEGLIPTLRICEWDETDRNKRVVSFWY